MRCSPKRCSMRWHPRRRPGTHSHPPGYRSRHCTPRTQTPGSGPSSSRRGMHCTRSHCPARMSRPGTLYSPCSTPASRCQTNTPHTRRWPDSSPMGRPCTRGSCCRVPMSSRPGMACNRERRPALPLPPTLRCSAGRRSFLVSKHRCYVGISVGTSVGETVGGAVGESVRGMGLSFFEMPFAKKEERSRENRSAGRVVQYAYGIKATRAVHMRETLNRDIMTSYIDYDQRPPYIL